MSEFVYLYRRAPRPPETPQKMQDRMQRWRAWFKDLETKGHITNLGQPLAQTGGGVVRDSKGGITDGPYAETKDIVMGYTLVQATDFDEAVRLTKGWPGFEEGGVIEVRPVMKL
jgi:hypothetical protein